MDERGPWDMLGDPGPDPWRWTKSEYADTGKLGEDAGS